MTSPSQPKRTLLIALREHYFDPSRNKLANDPRWKYGMPALIVFLLAGSIWISFTIRQPNPARYLGLVVSTSLLLNHLSAYFHFGPRYTFPFRLFATIFTLAVAGYALAYFAR